ncbi:MAG: photosystem II protein PsbQ [Scytonema sp. PMC 1069.18]|nr:photosystem II protein PsbQ [Scytonema sp. PMC 1069.18]MEC4887868.1 photosystem II protein PsbQ [Scytonema sp. PMC 1070.18]
MARHRSILSLILVLLATFLISCGSPTVATVPSTYTPAQLEKIQEYLPEVLAVRDRSAELQRLIDTKQWIKVGNFIHGPMAEARLSMNYISSNLLPKDQSAGRELVRDLLDHLVKIDQAASSANYQIATSNSKAAFGDIDTFLNLIPQPSPEPTSEEA